MAAARMLVATQASAAIKRAVKKRFLAQCPSHQIIEDVPPRKVSAGRHPGAVAPVKRWYTLRCYFTHVRCLTRHQ
jgi:hypothetical protein